MADPKVSFVQRFHCNAYTVNVAISVVDKFSDYFRGYIKSTKFNPLSKTNVKACCTNIMALLKYFKPTTQMRRVIFHLEQHPKCLCRRDIHGLHLRW